MTEAGRPPAGAADAGRLRRGVGLGGVVMFGAGTAIGVSIFSVLQPAAEVAGAGLLLAMLLAAVPMVPFALCYAYLGSVAPVSGASYEWPRRFLHPLVGFAVAWLRIVGNVGALVVLARVLANYLGMVVALPGLAVALPAICLVFALNYRGVAVAARVQVVLMALLLVVLALFAGTGLPLAQAARIGPLAVKGWPAIVAGVPLMISLFLGIESAVEIGEEVRDPRRTIPLGIAMAVALTVVVYGAVASVALGLVGPERLAASRAPLLDAAAVPLGRWATPLIVGAATVSILKTMNATALVFSRALFAMAREGALPAALARVHPRHGTPHVAVAAAFACALAGLAMPSSLVFVLLAVNIPTMLKYAACCLAAARVAAAHPALHAAALPLGRTAVRVLGWTGCAAALAIIVAGLGADARPYWLLAGWLILGLGFHAVRRGTIMRGRRRAPR